MKKAKFRPLVYQQDWTQGNEVLVIDEHVDPWEDVYVWQYLVADRPEFGGDWDEVGGTVSSEVDDVLAVFIKDDLRADT